MFLCECVFVCLCVTGYVFAFMCFFVCCVSRCLINSLNRCLLVVIIVFVRYVVCVYMCDYDDVIISVFFCFFYISKCVLYLFFFASFLLLFWTYCFSLIMCCNGVWEGILFWCLFWYKIYCFFYIRESVWSFQRITTFPFYEDVLLHLSMSVLMSYISNGWLLVYELIFFLCLSMFMISW